MKVRTLLLPFILTGMWSIAYCQFSEAADNHDILNGATDLHIHSSPDMFGRSVTDLQVAQLAKSHGMKAIVLKNHISSTAGRAALVNEVVDGIIVYGGIVLNNAVGGINPEAVSSMARLSPQYGKIVWFPTFDAQAHKDAFAIAGEGLEILRDGKLTEEVEEVLNLILEYDLVLATGHLSSQEIIILIQRANELGIQNLLITHPMGDVPGLSQDEMQQLADLGAKLELAYLGYLSGPQSHLDFLRTNKHVSVEATVRVIRTIGSEHFVLSSDLGKLGAPIPPDGLRTFIELLIQNGIAVGEVSKMVKDNPNSLFE